MISLGAYEYHPADVLGNGAFAIVYKGRMKNNPDEPVAIKIMLKDQNVLKSKTLLSKEIHVLKDLNHENIVQLYDHSISTSGVYLVMEYCNGGDLAEYLQVKKTLPEETIRHFLVQIGSAMDAMNRKGFMHRDLKPGNILLSHCRNCGQPVAQIPGYLLAFKLADFGFARFLQDGMMAVTMCGSPMYMAPEVLMCRKYDAAADIWSMGIIVYQCLTGKAPFYANTPEALKNIYERKGCLRPKIPITTSKPLQDLLLRMLVRKPSERIDFRNFLSHPFLHQKHFEPRGRRGVNESNTPRSNIAPALPSRNRPVVRGSGITALGQGTGEGPYYLHTLDTVNRGNRDGTPQGKPLVPSRAAQETPGDSLNPPQTQNWTYMLPNDLRSKVIPTRNQMPPVGSPEPIDGLNLDDIDEDMTKTTVDEYIEDGPGTSTHLFEHMRPYKPKECNASDNCIPSFDYQYNNRIRNAQLNPNMYEMLANREQKPGQGVMYARLDHLGALGGEVEYNDPPLDDYVIVNSDGSEVQRIDRDNYYRRHQIDPSSRVTNVGCIVRNPGVYLSNNICHRRGQSLLPDVTVGTTAIDQHTRQDIQDAQLHQNYNHDPQSNDQHQQPASNINNLVTQPLETYLINETPTEQNITNAKCIPEQFINKSKLTQPTNPYTAPTDSGIPNEDGHSTISGIGPLLSARQTPNPTSEDTGDNTTGVYQVPTRNHFAHLLNHDRRSFANATEYIMNTNEPDQKRPHSGAGLLEYGRNFENDLTSGDILAAAEFSDELLMEPEHNEEIKKITMVLELCELLGELAERRESTLADCSPTQLISHVNNKSNNNNNNNDTGNDNGKPSKLVNDGTEASNTHVMDNTNKPKTDTKVKTGDNELSQSITGLKFVSEARRIVEQIVLYRRVLYYLEYVFVQVKKAFQNGRLKSTVTARRRLIDCNTLYHRCYIRLRQLSKQSRREDLIEPVGRLLVNITANRLIFQYALDQCYAAEMDEYIGELPLSLQRYKAGITLIHGLCQHAKSNRDKTLLADCMRLLRDRYACLWSSAMKANPNKLHHHREQQFTSHANQPNSSPMPPAESSSPLPAV